MSGFHGRGIRLFSRIVSGRVLPNIQLKAMSTATSSPTYEFETLKVTVPKDHVYHVQLNRPDKLNAMNKAFWREMRECFTKLSDDTACRVVVVSGSGRGFTAGLDLIDMADFATSQQEDVARRAFELRKVIKEYQGSFTAIEKCPKIVIAAVHGFCIGGGVDLISSCDIRYCTSDSFFQIKEVDIGLAADVGTLQRLPKIVGNESLVRELAVTARKFYAHEAEKMGAISRVFPDQQSMMASVEETAVLIASKSPVAVQGTKIHLNYARDHTVEESLDYIANWNQVMLQSEDLMKSVVSFMEKKPAKFSNL